MSKTDQKNLRIDYSKYQVDEVTGTIADAMLFPLYVGKVFAKVVLLFMLVLGVFTFFYVEHAVLGILFFLLAFAVSVPSLALFSVIRLFTTIRDDIDKIFEITLDTAKYVYNDTKALREQHQNDVPLKSSFTDVFRGVALYVIRPSLKRVIAKRIRFFSPPFVWIIDTMFKVVVVKKQPEFMVEVDDNEEVQVQVEGKSVQDKIENGQQKVTYYTFGVLKFPFRLALIIYGMLNSFLVWLFYFFLG